MKLSPELECYRVIKGTWASPPGKTFGMFHIPHKSVELKVIACDGKKTGWDHVSVSLTNRCPNWEEMCLVKSLFWDDEETVIQFHPWDDEETVFQFHPKKSEYVNNHPFCLHLWRLVGADHELPPAILVGLK